MTGWIKDNPFISVCILGIRFHDFSYFHNNNKGTNLRIVKEKQHF